MSSYVTKEVNPKGYEAHLKYADVQFLLAGEEVMRCCPLEYLTPSTEYDEAKDCRFYVDDLASHPASWSEGIDSAVDLRLGAGYFAVVFPDDAHIPQLAAGTPAEVKKIVMKVPVLVRPIDSHVGLRPPQNDKGNHLSFRAEPEAESRNLLPSNLLTHVLLN